MEDETKGLIVDQTIEKVSFCAPDRNHERGFSYICRDGTTRRWMCHGFLALRETGERLSHAVGCAFAVCLERKQKRDKECNVTMMFDAKNSTFTRSGSFRQQSITERIDKDTQNRPPPVNPFAIERPHATPSMLQRQGSFRGLGTLGQNSPFKRQMSLRVNDLPSNAERLSAYRSTTSPTSNKPVSPIPEDSVTALCQQLSQGLSQLTHSGSDDFNLNNQSLINQNSLTISITNTTNTFNQSITATPPVQPVSLSNSPNTTANSTASLPKPEQWLGQIVKSTSPVPTAKMDGLPARRSLPLGAHSRAMSLDSSEVFPKTHPDPFDAEWAALAARTNTNSTNPFLSNNSTPQAFQIHL